MDKNDDQRQQLILDVLAFKTGTGHDDVVARALWTWERLAAHLGPLIGEVGFCALYGRATRLAIPQYEWLAAGQSSQPVEILFATLKVHLLSIDQTSAGKANTALLDTFTKLLSGLVGEALTTRLLNSAWADETEGKNK